MNMQRGCARAFCVALCSRLLLLALGSTADYIVSDYDTSAQMTVNACEDSGTVNSTKLTTAIHSSVVWDSVYFERIARCGYEFDSFLAFFPGWPWLMHHLAGRAGVPWTQLAGLLANAVCFAAAASCMYGYVFEIFEALKDKNKWHMFTNTMPL